MEISGWCSTLTFLVHFALSFSWKNGPRMAFSLLNAHHDSHVAKIFGLICGGVDPWKLVTG